MKKTLLNLAFNLVLGGLLFAQAPEKMSYQAVVRNNNNVLVSNHAVGMRISILQGSATGTAVYSETQTPTTNANGLIAIEIGTGTVVTGTFANIDWSNSPYFVKTETDPNGGTNYTLTANNQLLSVPYALYAKKTDSARVAQVALNGVPSGSQHGQTLTNCDGNIVWTYNGQCPAKIAGFNCADTLHTGALVINQTTGTATTTVTYSGGNGGIYTSQSIASTGVTGLTATLAAGTLNNGNGTLTFAISGTPTTTGIANFTITLSGKTCTFYRTILATLPTILCNGTATAVVNVTNPTTGKTWMDRNLGATQAATSSTDAAAYGDLYQWGRRSDGHQCRNSGTTSTLSSTDQPTHANFIVSPNIPHDWRTPQNDNLWQGVNGVNNPCPTGYRLPTSTELEAERTSWSQNNSIGAFGSPLKLPMAGYRYSDVGSLNNVGSYGYYWSSTVGGTNAWNLLFDSGSAIVGYNLRAYGFTVRCIKDYILPEVGTLDTVGSTNQGTLTEGIAASNVSTIIAYTNGNGGIYETQTINSTGVTGLTATLAAGTLNNGNGTLSFAITGTPTTSGTASFTFTLGSKTCTFTRNVLAATTNSSNPVYCNGTATAVVNVTNPTTGKTWMDRNLGATQAATSSTDAAAYGDLYQWGRRADGHQCRNSGTTSTLSSTDQPTHANFILAPNSLYDWRTPQNDNLWQGVNGVNNPCPSGYRLPTNTELDAERTSWSQNNNIGAFGSPLKFPMAGYRYGNDGSLSIVGSYGYYWSSAVYGTYAWSLHFSSGNASMYGNSRAFGFSVRCLKD